MRARGRRGGRCAQGAAAGVTPVERGVGRGSGAVARRVDHVMRTVREPRNRLAIADFLIGGVEVRDVEAKPARAAHTDIVEPGGHCLGAQPARMPPIDVHGSGRVAGQRVDGVAHQVETFRMRQRRSTRGNQCPSRTHRMRSYRSRDGGFHTASEPAWRRPPAPLRCTWQPCRRRSPAGMPGRASRTAGCWRRRSARRSAGWRCARRPWPPRRDRRRRAFRPAGLPHRPGSTPGPERPAPGPR